MSWRGGGGGDRAGAGGAAAAAGSTRGAGALAEHLGWLRRNGRVPPPELSALLDALADPGGPERTTLGDLAVAADPLLVDFETAGRMLGVCERTVRRRVDAGALPAVRVGRRRLVPVAALEAYVEGRPAT